MKKSSGEQVKRLQTEEQSVEGRSRDRKINKGGKSQVDRMRSWATSCECVYVCIYLSIYLGELDRVIVRVTSIERV